MLATAIVPVILAPSSPAICELLMQLTQLTDKESALADPILFIEYGVDKTCWRGESSVGVAGLPLGLTLISRKRFAPLNAPAPKSRVTVKIPSTTAMLCTFCVEPIWLPFEDASQSVSVKSYKALIVVPLSVSLP